MLTDTAIAISIAFQNRRRGQARGSKKPRGMNSNTFPFALYMQKKRALEPVGRLGEEQVSDARLGRSSTPVVAIEPWLGVSVAAARPER